MPTLGNYRWLILNITSEVLESFYGDKICMHEAEGLTSPEDQVLWLQNLYWVLLYSGLVGSNARFLRHRSLDRTEAPLVNLDSFRST